MGCVSSKSDDHGRPNVFHVWNVDDMGNRVNPGEIVITETDLILYQRGKEPVLWPMKSLRRYGFDSELFSFESGRRCPTGPGVYAFRCRRAEALFTLLQEHIQSVGNIASSSTEENNIASNNGSTSLVNVDDLQRQADDNNASASNSEPRYCGCPCPSLSVATSETSQSVAITSDPNPAETNQYINGDVIQLECSGAVKEHEYVNTVVCPKRFPNSAASVGAEHEYMNTGIHSEGATASVEQVSSRIGDVNANTTTKTKNDKAESNPPSYYNIPKNSKPSKGRLQSQSSFSSPSSKCPVEKLPHSNSFSQGMRPTGLTSKNVHINGTKLKRDPFYSNVNPIASTSTAPSKTVHYAVLDLNGTETSPPPETPDVDQEEIVSDDDNNGKGYVTIDFDKTAALLSSMTSRQKQTVEILKKSQSDSLSK